MVIQRGRTSKPKSRSDASPCKSSQKTKAEDPEEDSHQEDADKEEHIDSNGTVNTHLKLNRQSILEFCAEYEAERRKQPAKKLPLLLDLLEDPQLGVLNVLFPGMECPPEWIAFQKKERARMRLEAAKAKAEYVRVPIVRKVSAFTDDHVIKFTRELQGKHIAVIKQDVKLKQFLLEYDMTLIGMLRTFFGAHDPVQVRDELTDVKLVKTENGVLADVGQYVSEIYTTLQGIQLPDDELNLVKSRRPTSEQYNKVCKELKELKLRLKNEGKNRSESHGKHQFRHSEEQPMVQGKDQSVEGKERLIPSCANCGKTGHSVSKCWKKGGGAYHEDQPAPPTKKLKSQLNPSNLKAQTAAITAMQSKFDKLCTLLEPLVKSQLEADQH